MAYRLTDADRARFRGQCLEPSPDDCWTWQGARGGIGYGYFRLSVERRNVPAHRVAYEIAKGPIPDGLQVDHLCRNRKCVNPSHLEAVTQRENLLRGEGASARNASKTVCANGHPLTPDSVYVYDGKRVCKACCRDHAHARTIAEQKRRALEQRACLCGCGRTYAPSSNGRRRFHPECAERRAAESSRKHRQKAHPLNTSGFDSLGRRYTRPSCPVPGCDETGAARRGGKCLAHFEESKRCA